MHIRNHLVSYQNGETKRTENLLRSSGISITLGAIRGKEEVRQTRPRKGANKLKIFKLYIMEKYGRNKQVLDGELDDNQVMMDLEKGKFFGLNPVGKRIWDLIEQPKSFIEIIQYLLAEFDVSEEQCVQEVTVFLDKAVASEIVTKHELDL